MKSQNGKLSKWFISNTLRKRRFFLTTFAPKMADINEIAVTYRQHLARLPKHNTRTDYSKRLAMLERWCSMHGITRVEEIDFLQFLDWVFYDRGVSPRTRNNYRTWLRSFCSWLRLTPNPIDDIKPMKEPGKIRQPLPTAILRQIRMYLAIMTSKMLVLQGNSIFLMGMTKPLDRIFQARNLSRRINGCAIC